MSVTETETAAIEPDWWTVGEMVAYYRLPNRRWLTDRLTPSHPDRVRHHRFDRNNPVFSPGDRQLFEERYERNALEGEPLAEPTPLASVVEIDPVMAARGAKALGLGA